MVPMPTKRSKDQDRVDSSNNHQPNPCALEGGDVAVQAAGDKSSWLTVFFRVTGVWPSLTCYGQGRDCVLSKEPSPSVEVLCSPSHLQLTFPGRADDWDGHQSPKRAVPGGKMGMRRHSSAVMGWLIIQCKGLLRQAWVKETKKAGIVGQGLYETTKTKKKKAARRRHTETMREG